LAANPAPRARDDNCGPNGLHAEPTLAATRAGKHVLCEKPLGRYAEESFAVWQGVAATGVVDMCAFNYRFVPGGAPGARADHGWAAGRDPSLPRAVPAVVGHRPIAHDVAVRL
jgi:hypothetical protein